MLLAIDIGNTNIVFAVYDGEALCGSWRSKTKPPRSPEDYKALIEEKTSGFNIKVSQITDTVISSVVPEVGTSLQNFCKDILGHTPIIVTKDLVGLEIDIENPEEVGADRLVNALAVTHHYQAPAIVIDFGTATTFDVIDAKGRYAGGVIAPGVNLSVSALHQATAKLPQVDIKKPTQVIGKSTVSAMHSGIYWGYQGLIEGITQNIAREMKVQPFILATGGLAPLFAEDTAVINQVDQELTLKGLLKVYQKSKQ